MIFKKYRINRLKEKIIKAEITAKEWEEVIVENEYLLKKKIEAKQHLALLHHKLERLIGDM